MHANIPEFTQLHLNQLCVLGYRLRWDSGALQCRLPVLAPRPPAVARTTSRCRDDVRPVLEQHARAGEVRMHSAMVVSEVRIWAPTRLLSGWLVYRQPAIPDQTTIALRCRSGTCGTLSSQAFNAG